jgi:antirestriction protein
MKKEITRVYLNTWEAYNNGFLGYGWMDAWEAMDFIEEDPERDGGEWFIADIDNYLGVDFGNLEYCNVMEVLKTIQTLEDMEEWEVEAITAIMEYTVNNDIEEAINSINNYTIYSDIESYFDSMDELIDFTGSNEIIERYFDYEAYHRDCMFDAYEASNGVVLVA